MINNHKISETLYNYSVSDFNENLLKDISIQELIDVVNNNINDRTTFRACWVLEHMLLRQPNLLKEYKIQIINIFLDSNNWSALRSISKLIMALLKNPLRYVFYRDKEIEGYLLDKTFSILSDKDCPIAVRCNAYDIAFMIGLEEEYILRELKTQIHFDLEKSSTPALRSRAKKILKKLERIA